MTTPPPYGPPPGYPGHPGFGYAVEPTSPRGEPLAKFEQRLLAYLIDGAVTGAIAAVLVAPALVVAFLRLTRQVNLFVETADQESVDLPASVFLQFFALIGAAIVISVVVSYVYHVEVALRAGGATPGKRIMKLRIAPLDPNESLTRRHLAVRWLAALGLSLVAGLNWVDGLWQLWDKPYRQCLHDKAARTVVTRLST